MKPSPQTGKPAWIEFVVRHPHIIIALCILITLLMAWQIPDLVIDPDIKNMMPQDEPVIQSISRMEEIFGGSEIVILSLTGEDIFTLSTLEKIDNMTAEIEDLPFVERVFSVTNAFEIKGTELGFEVRDLIAEFPTTAGAQAALRRKVKDNDLIYGNIVSEDFKRAAVIATLSVNVHKATDEETYQAFTRLAQKYRGPEEIHCAGLPLTRRAITTTMQSDMKKFFPFGIALMIFLLVFSFRSWAGAFLPLTVVIMSVIWSLGLMALIGYKFTFISMLMPVMLIAIANDYSIHIVAHYFEDYRRYPQESKVGLVRLTVRQLKTPVFFAGITTLVGFLSLQSHILPPARQLGLLSACGITIAFVLSVTFVPAALALLPLPLVLTGADRKQRMNRFLTRWGNFFMRHRKGYLIGSLFVIIFIATGIPRIIVDTNPMHYYKKSAPIRIANEIINRSFGGSSQLSILAEGDIKAPEMLHKMESLADYLEKEPTVTRTSSIVDMIQMMNRAFHSDSAEYETIPPTREAVAQYLLLFSLSGDEEDLDKFVDYDYKKAQVIARVDETSSMSLHKLLQDTRQFVKAKYDPATFPEITGITAVIGELIDMVVRGQMRSLLISIVIVGLLSALMFRSLSAGLLSIVPLTGAILIVFGLMGYLGIELNIATAMLSSIMIGVGIDYTIHFLYRLRREARMGATPQQAVIATLTTSGKGIIYNALSVIIGFVVLLLSGFLPIFFFGFLIVFSITACLIGALTIMPAIVVWINPAFIKNKRIKSSPKNKEVNHE